MLLLDPENLTKNTRRRKDGSCPRRCQLQKGVKDPNLDWATTDTSCLSDWPRSLLASCGWLMLSIGILVCAAAPRMCGTLFSIHNNQCPLVPYVREPNWVMLLSTTRPLGWDKTARFDTGTTTGAAFSSCDESAQALTSKDENASNATSGSTKRVPSLVQPCTEKGQRWTKLKEADKERERERERERGRNQQDEKKRWNGTERSGTQPDGCVAI